MDFKLKMKINGEWKEFGRIKENKWGNNQASFKIQDLKDLIAIHERDSKEWVNLSLYENNQDGNHAKAKGNAYVKEDETKLQINPHRMTDWEDDDIPTF